MSSGGHAALSEGTRALAQLEPLPSADEYDSEVDMARLAPVVLEEASWCEGASDGIISSSVRGISSRRSNVVESSTSTATRSG